MIFDTFVSSNFEEKLIYIIRQKFGSFTSLLFEKRLIYTIIY